MNAKQEFSEELFRHLNTIEGVVLKHLDEKTASDSYADIDVLVKPLEVNTILSFIQEHPLVEEFQITHLQSMQQFFIHFNDNSFLQLDVLFKLVRKQYEYLNTADVFASKTINVQGISVYSTIFLLEHVVLFNALNYSGVPQKYIKHFNSFPDYEQQQLLEQFNDKYQSTILSFEQFAQFDTSLRKQIIRYLENQTQNNIWRKIRHLTEYGLDKVREVFSNKGKIITFSGVDGAGKSTIIDLTKKTLTEKYRKKVVVLRHRPSLLPIISAWKYGKKNAEQRTVSTLPHSGSNKNSLSSLIRFFYYYSDYLFGQIYIHAKYIRRGYFVLYDRYYFDFIIDGKRSNLQVPQGLSRGLYRFVQKPSLNFFLFADANTIHARKQELPISTIELLTKKYRHLFEELNKKSSKKNNYLVIENIDKEKTLHTIIDNCKKVF